MFFCDIILIVVSINIKKCIFRIGKNYLDLSGLFNAGSTEKRFYYVIIKNNHLYVCECNFYASGGSKFYEISRIYKTLALESKDIKGFIFIWFT